MRIIPPRLLSVRLACLVALAGLLAPGSPAHANPPNGKVVFQAYWWDCWNERYPFDWYTYLAKLAPRLRDMGFDGIWAPPPAKAESGGNSMGYDPFDHYDLGDKDQKGRVGTRFGTKDSLLRLIAVAHANGLEVYPDVVLNHVNGGRLDPAAPGNQFKKFRYTAFAGPDAGRWPKDHWNFHPNPDHDCNDGDLCTGVFGPDVCYRDAGHGGGGNGKYMRDKSREWFVWLKKQLDADGFRFDAVKHYEAYVVEDVLFNAMGDRKDYFAVGELIAGSGDMDDWCALTNGRGGTLDFSLRGALAEIVNAGGFFDMGSLPGAQQGSRAKTSPFINSHDTWHGAFWDSASSGSMKHDDRDGDWRLIQNEENGPTIDPDNDRADVAYAAAFAVDGSPVVFYEDLFVNFNADTRFKADPKAHPTRGYVENLVWCHQKLNFKDGAYKVRFQGSPDLLVIERGGRAVVGLNDHGDQTLKARVATDFGGNVRLHDYSGSNADDVQTAGDGSVEVSVPPRSYAVWGPAGVSGGFAPAKRRTTQEFQLDDDLGDVRPSTPGYGGKVNAGSERTAGAVWAAAGTKVKVSAFTDGARDLRLAVYRPDATGQKSRTEGDSHKRGPATNDAPLVLEFTADREGYHAVAAKLTNAAQTPTRAYLKVEYEAPRTSGKF